MKTIGTFLFLKTGKARKKLNGRSGSLLILVLVIMAVALILITSAMTITVAARRHYNEIAETDQSHLTAMSGAKLIGDAVEKGKITKAQLVLLADSAAEYYLTGSNSIAPGMAGTSTSSASYTKASFGYSNAAHDYITATVVTHIDNAAVAGSGTDEKITLFMKLIQPVIPGGFDAALAINGSGILPSLVIGTNVASNYGSNFVTINAPTGTYLSNNGSAIYGGDCIITSKVQFGNEMTINGNMMLYGGAASIDGDGTKKLPTLSATSHFLHLCEASFPGLTFWSTFAQTSQTFTPVDIILKNASMNFLTSDNDVRYIRPQNNIVYTIGGQVQINGTPVSAAVNAWNPSETYFTVTPKPNDGTTAVLDALITKYTDPAGAVQKSLTFDVPQTRADLMDMLGMDKAYATTTPTSSIIAKLQSEYGAVAIPLSTATYTGQAYIINISGSPNLGYPITFDLSNNDITLYVVGVGRMDFISKDPGLRFIRPAGSGNIGRIIFMEDSASFHLGNAAGTLINFPGITGAGKDYDRYSKGDDNGIQMTDLSEPYVYIYGFNNKVDDQGNMYVEGYYGLFGHTGTFEIGNQNINKVPTIYARFNVTNFVVTSGSLLPIPYCPAPGEDANNPKNQPRYIASGFITN